jgi:hypothetical protein
LGQLIKIMNWGKGIIGGMILFMLFIIGMSIKMFSIPTDDFDTQYYERGLNFDKDQVREQRVITDKAKPLILIAKKEMHLTFAMPASGTIKFVRPSDKLLDKQYLINTGTGKAFSLLLTGIRPGQWQLILEWESSKKAYLYQQEIYIK